MDSRINLYTSIVPNHRQKIVQDMKFYAFIHFTVNTYTGKEWGDGKESPQIFNPTNLDTDSWCQTLTEAGMKGVILTCKHHDGFCLWPTLTTEHSVKNSPYKNGNGDIVAELAKSAKKYGLKFGVYLSPWDRNSEYYSTEKYMDFYIAQLTELLSNYGEIFMLWLDGACGAHMDGKPAQKYDFDRIYSTALALQPNIAMSGCAPDIRWVGNESGIARESEWNVVPKYDYSLQNLMANCQQNDDLENFQKRCQDVMVKDMGSREFLSSYDEFIWYPAEVDVSIRKGWFYHDKSKPRSLNKLMRIYYNSVGGNSLLLLNIPPNKLGLFDSADIKMLKTIGEWLKKEEDLTFVPTSIKCNFLSKDGMSENDFSLGGTLSPKNTADKYEISLNFEKTSIDRIVLQENCDYSQRIEKFNLYTLRKNKKIKIYTGTVVGFNKIAIFKPTVTDNLIIEVEKCRNEPYIQKIAITKTGAFRPSTNLFVKIYNKLYLFISNIVTKVIMSK